MTTMPMPQTRPVAPRARSHERRYHAAVPPLSHPARGHHDSRPTDRQEPGRATATEVDHVHEVPLARVFASLPHDWRRALWLRVVERRAVRDVAELLSTEPESVENWTGAALMCLRRSILITGDRAGEQAGSDACRGVVRALRFSGPNLSRAARHTTHEHALDCDGCLPRLKAVLRLDQCLAAVLDEIGDPSLGEPRSASAPVRRPGAAR